MAPANSTQPSPASALVVPGEYCVTVGLPCAGSVVSTVATS